MTGSSRPCVAEGFEPLAAAFDQIVARGLPAALHVRDGASVVVDLFSGEDRDGHPFTSATPVFLYSAVKPVTALAVLLAVADGALELDAPVARTWRAFGVHDKDAVTVRDALAHGAAVPGWRTRRTLDEFADPRVPSEALAASEPWWTPGEPGEHAVSYGHLVDGILRHATGTDIAGWWRQVRAAGVDVALSPERERPPAPLEDPGGRWCAAWSRAEGVMADLLRNPPGLLDVGVVNGLGRRIVAPAVTGYGSARDLAALWSWWSGPDGCRRLGEALRGESLSAHLRGHDHVLDGEVAWGLGMQIDDDFVGMGGVGGCVGGLHVPTGLTLGFTTPRVGTLDRLDPLETALATL